jgi:hypothetical protein
MEEDDEKGALILPEEVFEQLFPHFNNKFGGIIDLDNDLGPMLGSGDVNIRTPSLWKTTRKHPVQQVKGDTILSLWYTPDISGMVVRGVWKPADIEELPEVDWIREQGFVQLKYRTTSWEEVREWWVAKESGEEVREWWLTNEAYKAPSNKAKGFIGKVIEIKLKGGKSMIEVITVDKVDRITLANAIVVNIKDVTMSKLGHPHYMVDGRVKLKHDQIIRVIR